MKYLTILFITLSCSLLTAQENINLELVANVPTSSSANDCWGYVDQAGIEYAIVGTRDDTRVYSLADPTAPEELMRITGSNTTWRDMKSYGDYVYSISDNTSDGLTIIDMRELSHSIVFPSFEFNGGTETIINAHNLYIDENGILYMAGGNVIDGGIVFLDLNTNPTDPEVIGYIPERYSHDIYVKGDTLYSSEIFDGDMSIYDISDKKNPVRLGGAQTSFSFTHNAWLSDDGNTVFTTDERENAYVDAYDISDTDNIRRLSSIRPRANGDNVMPHNTHYKDGFLITSWYGDGVIVIDVHEPDNMVIVGRYDTNPDASEGGVGCWGAYPFLPSGLIIASDRQYGLYVLQPEYKRASYLEGCITDEVTGAALNGVEISIPSAETKVLTDVSGEFKTGVVEGGSYQITLKKEGYRTKTITVSLVEGELNILKEAMEPSALRSYEILLVDAETDLPVEGRIFIHAPGESKNSADTNGLYKTTLFENEYTVTVAAWGYYHKTITAEFGEEPSMTIRMEPGYQDDFFFDFEWEAFSSFQPWTWVVSPDMYDPLNDLGNNFYRVFVFGDNSISLSSPVMDLTSYDEPEINVSVSNFGNTIGTTTLHLITPNEEILAGDIGENPDFQNFTIDVNEYLTDIEEVTFVIRCSTETLEDIFISVDQFIVKEGEPSSLSEIEFDKDYTLYPNPVEDILYIKTSHDKAYLKAHLYDLNGRLVKEVINDGQAIISVPMQDQNPGLYLLKLITKEGHEMTQKVIKS